MGLLEKTVLGTPKKVHLQKLEQKQNRFGPTWKTLAFGLSGLQFFFGNRWNFRTCQCRFCYQVIYLPGRRWNPLLGSFRQVAELKVIISPIPTEAESSLELRFERYNFPHLWRLKLMGVGGGGDFGYTRDGLNLQQLTICDAISKSFDIKKKSEIHNWFWIFWWFFLQIYTVCIYSIYIHIHTGFIYTHTHTVCIL